jgi:hypothetical protein
LTLSKVTIAYTVFAMLHCFIQMALQADAFALNDRADLFLKSIVNTAGFHVSDGMDLLIQDATGGLYACSIDPYTHVKQCHPLWNPGNLHGHGNSPPITSSSTSNGTYAAASVRRVATLSSVFSSTSAATTMTLGALRTALPEPIVALNAGVLQSTSGHVRG